MWLAKARGSSKHSFHVELAGGGRHAQLNASMAPCLAVLVCLFITIMAKSVKTSLDDVSGSQSSEQFWSNLFFEAQLLCTPSRVCEDRRQYPPTQTSLSLTGPKSCPLKPVTVGKVPVRQSFKPFSQGHVPNSCSERAEGSWHQLQCQGELATVSAASETAKPIPITMPPSGRKKSWLRVVRRVAARGSAQYRGKWWTLKQIPAHDLAYVRQCTGTFRSGTSRTGTSRKPQQTGPSPTRTSSLKTRSVQFLCWNAGGLPTQCYDEILQFSRANALDVIALVETRRRQSMLWTSSEYTAVQSGEDKPQQSYAGILLLVKHVATLRYEHVVPGRLLHAHVTRHDLPVPLDILVVYQKWIDEAADANAMELATEVRHHVWNELDRTLAMVPRRHSLLVLGDFNTRVAKSLPVFSSGDPSFSYSSDSDLFTSICHRHSLHHCHRAQGASGTTYRYGRKDVGSRIDYALVRSSMRACCTTSSLEWSLPFLVPNDTGYHCVLQGGFRTSWTSWRTGTTSTSRSAPIVLDQDLLRSAQRCDHSLYQRYQELLAERCHADMCLDVMCNTVHEAALEVFGRSRRQKAPPPWASSELTSLCQKKWNAFVALRKCSRDSSLASIFSNWSAITLVMRITRQYKQMGRKLRRCWLETLLDEAKALADARDPSFFRVIRILSPKTARSPYGTRCKLSAASSTQDEIACFAEHYKTLFAATSPTDVLAKPSWQWLQQCSSTVLDTYFAKIPLFKSVFSGHCIGAAWRIALQTTPIRSCLDKVLSGMPSSGVPARFCNGSLILLPKPGKSGKEVNHYTVLLYSNAPLERLFSGGLLRVSLAWYDPVYFSTRNSHTCKVGAPKWRFIVFSLFWNIDVNWLAMLLFPLSGLELVGHPLYVRDALWLP